MTNIAPIDPKSTDQLPALAQGMPPSMALWFDDAIFERAKQIATYLSKADGFVPQHLIHKPEACFAVVERALTWKLSPYAVAQCTYQTPGGRVGFEGKLCQAILENSGKLVGGVKFTHFGDWSKVQGKFEIKKSDKGKDYAKPTWTRADAKGLGVTVSAQVRGEVDLREWTFELEQAFPLNSTLWATDPKSQICYTAVRRFGNLAAPGLFMGVPFDREDFADIDNMRDVSPRRPTRADFGGEGQPTAAQQSKPVQDVEPEGDDQGGETDPEASGGDEEGHELFNIAGEVEQPHLSSADFAQALCEAFQKMTVLRDLRQLEENNHDEVGRLPEAMQATVMGAFDHHVERLTEAQKARQRTQAGGQKTSAKAADKKPEPGQFTLKNIVGKVVESGLDAGAFAIEIDKLFQAAEMKVDLAAIERNNRDAIAALPENHRADVIEAYDKAGMRFGHN